MKDMPSGLWVTWYGDDFTGAAAVMEVLTFAGVPSVLFTEIPSPELLQRFKDVKAIGLASTTRTKNPQWMRENLPEPLTWLDGLNAPLLHYKVCSTFDSGPEVGSIGTAIEVGLTVRPAEAVPMITAAPQMRRYQSFGHLFAGTFEGVHRLDRHPVMSRHPVTAMQESDLLKHLSHQTTLKGALIDLEALGHDAQKALDKALAADAKILSIDSMDQESEKAAGRLVWENRERLGFVVGSQGVEYALLRHWQEEGLLANSAPPPRAEKLAQIAAISGSVSPTTEEQLDCAQHDGFALIRFRAETVFASPSALQQERERVILEGLEAAGRGASPIIYSARGPEDAGVAAFKDALSSSSMSASTASQKIGESLGQVLGTVLEKSRIGRAVISGGDTSGYSLLQLGIKALVAKAPTIPGASISVGYGETIHDGLEVALKGGQMGSRDFFSWVRDGGGPR